MVRKFTLLCPRKQAQKPSNKTLALTVLNLGAHFTKRSSPLSTLYPGTYQSPTVPYPGDCRPLRKAFTWSPKVNEHRHLRDPDANLSTLPCESSSFVDPPDPQPPSPSQPRPPQQPTTQHSLLAALARFSYSCIPISSLPILPINCCQQEQQHDCLRWHPEASGTPNRKHANSTQTSTIADMSTQGPLHRLWQHGIAYCHWVLRQQPHRDTSRREPH